jgi:hypothetical protein
MYECEKHAELHLLTAVSIVKAVFPEYAPEDHLEKEYVSLD